MSPPVDPIAGGSSVTPSAPEENSGDDQMHVVALVGDVHNHQVPYFQGFFTSHIGNTIAPAHRLPAMNMGITEAFEALLRGGVPANERSAFEGVITTGDLADINSTEELKVAFESMDRLKKADPIYRNLLFMVGNHDVLHYGVSRSGWDFGGLLGIIMRKGGVESYKKDIQIPEVGGRDKVLDKEVMIRMTYKSLFDKDPDPAELDSSTYTEYSLKKGDRTQWDDTGQVFRDFWKQEKDGRWNALVHYLPGAKSKPEKAWIYASSVKMGDFKTSEGDVPLYFISLDTMDYLNDGMQLGALEGHVSDVQVRIVEAFMETVRSSEPGAKFVLGGHHPITGGSFKGITLKGVSKIKESGLGRILSDEDVLAFVAAHTHDRGYADLADLKSVDRTTPLPQITVPSVIGYPNEMVLFKYGVEESDPSKLVLQFDYTGIDPETLPGNSEAVCAELKEIRPELLIHDDAIAHIKDDQIREFADPETTLGKRIDIAVNLDTGVVTRPDRVHDEIIKEDVIPGMVEDTQYYLRAFMSVLKLSLIEAGMEEEAVKLEASYLKNVDHLNENYERIWKGDYQEEAANHEGVHVLDQYMGELDQAILDFEATAKEKIEAGALDPTQKERLEYVEHVLPLVRGFLGDYRYWLGNYGQKLQTERGPRDFIYDANHGGSFYFKAVTEHMREVPYGSAAWAFLVHAFLEAGEQHAEFYGDETSLQKKVPDSIRIELLPSGERNVVLSPLTEEDKKVKRRGWCDPDIPHYAEEAREKAQATVVPSGDRGVEWHWSSRLGPAWQTKLESSLLLSGEFGGQIHLLNRWDKPRVNLALHVGGTSDFDNYGDVYGKASVRVGDPWGLIEAGPTLKGGVVLMNSGGPADAFIGVGLNVGVFEGLVSFDAEHLWYDEGRNGWRYSVNVDLATGLRALNWSGVAKWVGRDF